MNLVRAAQHTSKQLHICIMK